MKPTILTSKIDGINVLVVLVPYEVPVADGIAKRRELVRKIKMSLGVLAGFLVTVVGLARWFALS